MKIAINLISHCAVFVMITCFLAPGEAKASDQKVSPNIVMIFVDDLHYGGLGVTGSHNTKAKTPAIDSIFKDGVRFTSGYATHAVCAPSRAGLMTGRYQARFGFETLPGGTEERVKSNYGVDTREVMISALLKKAGYATCAIGKWHLGTNQGFQPHERGFDHWFGYLGSCGYYQFRSQLKTATSGKTFEVSPDEQPILNVVRNGHPVRVPGYLTDAFAKEASDWIRKQKKDKPFFIYFAPYNAHAPDKVPATYIPDGGTAHDGVIAAMDASIAAILDALEAAGVANNTLIVFSNDNGGKKDLGNNPFRGNKATYYEGGVRVPFAMRWPRVIKPNTRFDGMVSTLDMLPTFAAAAGVKTDGLQLDGKNLLPFLNGAKPTDELRQIHFWRTGKTMAARKGDWKLVWPIDPAKHKKLLKELGIEHFKGRRTIEAERNRSLYLKPELYNLATDIGETTDVAAKHPNKVAEIVKDITAWEATLPKHPASKPKPKIAKGDKPNIILIMADDLGAECLGAYGALDCKTPNLDHMANTGVRFDRCYSTPLCTPSRVQIMTGRYTHRNYVGFGKFPDGEITFGKMLKDAGYATCMVGKWQLGGDYRTPIQLGFDEYCLQNQMLPKDPFDKRSRGRERYWGYPVITANGKLYESKERYGPDMLNEYARDFIRRKKDRPFFLYYPLLLPHSPFAPSPQSKDGDKSGAKVSELKYFKDMVEYIDHLVGQIAKTLDEEGIRENTVVMFTGDNGTTYPVKVTKPAPAGYPKMTGINGARHLSQLTPGKKPTPKQGFEGPLTRTDHGDVPGGKDLMSERGVHVPLVIDWPRYRANHAKINHRNDGLVDFTDFVPTLCELAGAKMPQDRTMDGKSFVRSLKGETSDTDRPWVFCHYWEFGRKKEAARSSIHDKRWKLYDNGDFFDLQNDLEEKKPLSKNDLDKAAKKTYLKLGRTLTSILAPPPPEATQQPTQPTQSPKPPNVVLIFADDMGYGDVGYHGYKDVLTPNIDRIAREGVHFRQGYVSASVCGPSRAGLMTGVYQQRVGAGENASATGYPNIPERFRMSGLPTSQPTLAEILRPEGYRCGMIGKWHLGVEKPLRPHNRGFNFFWGFLNGSHSYIAWENKFAHRKDKWPLFRNDRMLPPAENVYLTDLFSDRAIGFIKHNTEKPFFLYLAYNAVHHPWQVPDKYLQRTKHVSNIEDRSFFAAMILAMDDGVGRILKTLGEAGVADNTIVIFLSDNGSPRGQGLRPSPKNKDRQSVERGSTVMSNPGPFRGFKGDTYEGGIRVPFTMRWPAKIKPNTRYDHPASALDIAPTIAATVGIDKPSKGHAFDGVNLLPYLNGDIGDARPHDVLYWRRDNDYAIREGDWKLTWNDAGGSMSIKLFDLATDPGEHHDLATKHTDRAQRMQDLFDAWDSTMPDSKPWGGPGNRNRGYAKGHRVDVAKYNANPPTRPPAKVRNN